MASKITQSTYDNVLSGSTEKRVDFAPDGRLWTALPEANMVKMYSSVDGGSTWRYAAGSDIEMGNASFSPSLFIDVDGFAHLTLWQHVGGDAILHYARGVPVSGGGWVWTKAQQFTGDGPAGGRADIVAFPHGTGWVAFVAYPGINNNIHLAKITIGFNGSVIDFNRRYLSEETSAAGTWAALDFNHVGDGKTPRADPHIYLAQAYAFNRDTLVASKFAYAAGAWSVGPRVAGASLEVPTGDLNCLWDGDRFYVIAGYPAGGPAAVLVQWTNFDTALNTVAPPELPKTEIYSFTRSIAVTHDVVTDDLYVLVQGTSATHTGYLSDILMSKFTRSTSTWSAWTKIIDVPNPYMPGTASQRGKVQVARHSFSNLVHAIYATYEPQATFAGTHTIFHEVVATLPRNPAPPTLISPPSGASRDLQAGASFDWAYSKTGPLDSQQAWALRRNTDGVLDYWNAGSQAWQDAEVFNAGVQPTASFPLDAWPNGRSYNWTVRTRSVYGFDSNYAIERTVVATSRPVVNIVNPIGSVLTESTPLIEFTYLSADPMSSFEARVFKSAAVINVDTDAPVWTSGVVIAQDARSVRIGVSLEDGASYVTYLRATSKTGLTSDWDNQAFSMAVSAPTGPLVQVSEARSYPENVPSVRLNLMTRSNFAGRDQAVGVVGWEVDSDAPTTVTTEKTWSPTQSWSPAESWGGSGSGGGGSTLVFQPTAEGDAEPGMILTASAAGNLAIRNVLGEAPPALEGQPAPRGPFDFAALGGQVYTGLAHVRAGTVARTALTKLRWFNTDEAAVQRVNLSAFGSFGTDDNGDGIATGFIAYSSGSTGTITRSVSGGRQRIQASALGRTATDRAGVWHEVNLEPGRKYTFSFDAIASTLPQGTAMVGWVDLIDGTGTFLSNHFVKTRTSGRQSITITTPPTVASAAVYLWVDGSGEPAAAGASVVDVSFGALLIEEADTALNYFDGSFISDARFTYTWVGEAFKSVSTATDVLDGLISESSGPTIFTSTTETRKALVTAEAPAGTKRAALVVELRDLQDGDRHHISRLSFHPDVDTAWQPGGSAGRQSLRVERSDDDGKTWKRIRDVVPVDRYQRAVTYDRSFVFGSRQRYRAFTDLQVKSGAVLSSGTSAPAAVTVNSDSWVFRDPRTPEVEILATVIGHRRSDKAQHSVQQPINARYPIVDMEGNTSAVGSLTIYVPAVQRAQMTEILRRGVPILVQSPIGEKWLAQFVARDYESMVGAQREITVDYVEII